MHASYEYLELNYVNGIYFNAGKWTMLDLLRDHVSVSSIVHVKDNIYCILIYPTD